MYDLSSAASCKQLDARLDTSLKYSVFKLVCEIIWNLSSHPGSMHVQIIELQRGHFVDGSIC